MSPGKPICEGRARGEGKPRNSPLADWPRPRNAQAQSAASLAVAPPSVVCAPSPVSPFTSHAWALGFSPPSLRARPKSTFYLSYRPVVSAVSFVGRNARGSLTQQRCFRRRISRNVVWAHRLTFYRCNAAAWDIDNGRAYRYSATRDAAAARLSTLAAAESKAIRRLY